jgi:TIR domain
MRIFLSYRREDASAWAGRLRDALAAQFGEENIFQDVATVRPGEKFTDAIDAALSRSDVALAVIGPRWLVASDGDGEPRLAKSDDYVRAELIAALTHTEQVIPVLVGGATMPTPGQLPEGLKELGLRQAVVLRDESWHQDVEGLLRSLRGKPTIVHRRRWLVGVGTIVAALAIGGAAWLVFRDAGTDASSNVGPGSSTTTAPKSCPTPSAPAWKDLSVTGSTDVGDTKPSWHFQVIDGHYRVENHRRWYVVLRSKATNRTIASQTHYPEFYKLSVEGARFEHDCFDLVGGQNPISPGGSSVALVGFELTRDPTRGFALDLDTIDEFGRIDLTPAAAS